MLPEYVQKSKKKDYVIIDDLTLEGDCEEMAGVTISEKDKIEIATRLSDMGVPRMSVLGYSPMPPTKEIRTVEKILKRGLPIKIGAFAKTREEIDLAARIGLWGVTILVSVSETRIARARETLADVIVKIKQLTSFAKDQDLYTIFMAQDSTRTLPESLKDVVQSIQADCDEICLADGGGVASPFGYRHLVELVGSWTKLPLSVHIHNHSSMAMANALGCVLGGVSILHASVNGMGEFTGILPLEEVAVALPMHLGVTTGIRLEDLKGLSDMVAHATGVLTSIHKPVVGDRAFCIPETEAIQRFFIEQAKLKPPDGSLDGTHPYPPRLVGNEEQMSIGRKCNEFTVSYHLAAHGLTADSTTIQAIVEAVRQRAAKAKGYYLMNEGEFIEMVLRGGFKLSLPNKNSTIYPP